MDQQKKIESLLAALNQQSQMKLDSNSDDAGTLQKTIDDLANKNLSLKQKNDDMLKMNSNLTIQNCQMQSKQGSLEDEVRTLKKYKKLVNNAIAVQCKLCLKTHLKENFQDHVKNCSEEQDRNRVSHLLPPSGNEQRNQPQILTAAPSNGRERLNTALGVGPAQSSQHLNYQVPQ